MTNLSHLTITQFSAYVELNRRSELWPSTKAWAKSTGYRTFARRTLQALVDSGVAEWISTPVGNCIIPIKEPAQIQADTQLSERTYCIGVPLVITVHDDGCVEFEVDLAEVPLDDNETEYDDEVIADDQILLDTALANIKYSHKF